MKILKIKELRFGVAWVLLVVLSTSHLHGQNVVYEIPNIDSEFSIIRNYRDSIDITLDAHLSTQRFSYFDRSNNLLYSFVSPVGINDFKIVNDTVYFCGGVINQKQSSFAIGWFDINNTFLGSGYITYLSVPIELKEFSNDYKDFLSGLLGIEVIKKSGYSHFFLHGIGKHSNTNSYNEPFHELLIDVVGSISDTNWLLNYTMDYIDQFWFDDIAVTKNYIVVSGRERGVNGDCQVVLPYSSPTSSSASQSVFCMTPGFIFPSLTETYYKCPSSIFQPTGDVQITAMGGDIFATVCDAIVGNIGSSKVVINEYNTPAIITNNGFFAMENNMSMGNIAYNSSSGILYMIPFHQDDLLYFTNSPYFSSARMRTGLMIKWLDIDQVHATTRNVLSGTAHYFGEKKYWWQGNSTIDDCTTLETIINSPLERENARNEVNQTIYEKNVTTAIFEVHVERFPVEILCR